VSIDLGWKTCRKDGIDNKLECSYPAVADFVNGPRQGASDMLNHVQSTLAACPDTKFVLVGYSQGG
jgi:hypothetical protein